ncbi:MAG: type II toxin-antitoxin system ParD family antitoxin [Deltaproteobacteria bacterium]
MRASMNISLEQPTREWVHARMKRAGFSTASEYIRHLIREDRQDEERAAVEADLLLGIESGPSSRMTRKDWEAIRSRGRRLAAKSKAT